LLGVRQRLPSSSLHDTWAPHSPGSVVVNQIRDVLGSMLIHGGTSPAVRGPPESSLVQLFPRLRERTTHSGPWRVFCGGVDLFSSSGA
jgi:hypothetical protein